MVAVASPLDVSLSPVAGSDPLKRGVGRRVRVRTTSSALGGDASERGTSVEIVWQEFVNFQSVTLGRMMMEVSEGG